MPSPIAHVAVSYAVHRIYAARRPLADILPVTSSLHLLIITAVFSLAPDLDFVLGLASGTFDRFHNEITHSLFSGLIFALAIGAVVWLSRRGRFAFWFTLALICYETHVIMDFFTVGRGVMLFWPFSTERYEPALKLFYGLHRSDGWLSVRHLWTLVSESVFTVLVVVMANWAARRLSKRE